MTGYLGKKTNWPKDVTGAQTQAERDDMLGPMPGEIVSWDPVRGVADIKPLLKKRQFNGEPLEYPVLKDVPVDMPRTANSGITFPIPVGTRVMLTPQMRSMENYDAEDDGSQSDARSFNLSDMRASIAGGDSLTDPLPNVDGSNLHVRFDPEGRFGIKGSPDGKIKIEGAEGNIYDILATFMELVASDQLMIAYGSSAGTGHALQNRAVLMELAAKVRAMAL